MSCLGEGKREEKGEGRKREEKEGGGRGKKEEGIKITVQIMCSCVVPHELYTSTQIRQTDKPTDASICDVQDMVIRVCLDPDGEVLRGTQSRLVCQREETNLVQCI